VTAGHLATLRLVSTLGYCIRGGPCASARPRFGWARAQPGAWAAPDLC